MNVRQVQRLSLRCIQQVRYASKPSEEFRFSQSAAYYGRDKIIQKQKVPNLSEPLYIPSPYDTIEFANRRLLYAVLSFFGLLAYFGYFR
jgi:hypothetical protein